MAKTERMLTFSHSPADTTCYMHIRAHDSTTCHTQSILSSPGDCGKCVNWFYTKEKETSRDVYDRKRFLTLEQSAH